MKKQLHLSVIATAVLLIASCSQNRYIVQPPFTDVAKISSLKKGMTLSDVNSALGIAPFDMYVSDEGCSIYSFNYRLKERRIPVNNNVTFLDRPGDPTNKSVNSEDAQKFGTDYYSDPKQLFITFKDDKLLSVISSDGLQRASQIIAITGGLAALKKDPQIKVLPDILLQNNVVVPLDGKGGYINNNAGNGVAAPGVIYMGNGTGVSTIPVTNPREIKGSRIPRKAKLDIIRKKRNKGAEVTYESDF